VSHSGPSSWQGASAPLLAALHPLLQPQLGGAACALLLGLALLLFIITLKRLAQTNFPQWKPQVA
jgi:hypothetical protein